MSEKSITVKQPTNFRVPQTLSEQRAFELLAEVRDLFDQYRREVPGKRRPWPESIKKRILELWSLGVSSHQIGRESDIPVMTLYSWRQRIKKEAGFKEVAINRKRRTKFQIAQDEERRSSELQLSQLKSPAMTEQIDRVNLRFASGLEVEGVPLDRVAELIQRLGGT